MSIPLALVWLGLLDLAWLEYVRAGLAPGCGAGSACVEVTSGPYGQLLGVPWTWWGLLYYAVMALALLTGSRWARPLSWLGLVASAALVGLQVAVIQAVCPFCLVSALACGLLAWKLRRGVAPVGRPRLAALVTLVLFGLALRAAYRDHVRFDPPTPEVSQGARHWRGPASAPLRLVVFLSLACPHCSELLERLREFQSQYPNQVALSVRHLPPDCPAGPACRGAARCEAAGDFWSSLQATEQIFAAQRQGQVSAEGLERFLGRPEPVSLVEQDVALAARLNLLTVPVMFVNDRRLRGPISPATLRRLLALSSGG